jgi:hypothetical protein
MFVWLIVRSAVHCIRKARRAWWLRLSSTGFEANDRLLKPRRYHWRDIDKFMLVAPSSDIEDAVVAPAKTFAEAFRDGGTQYPVFRVGFHCSPGYLRRLANRLFRHMSGLCGQDGTRADGLVMGYWDRPFDEAVDLMTEWLTRYKTACESPGALGDQSPRRGKNELWAVTERASAEREVRRPHFTAVCSHRIRAAVRADQGRRG